MKYIILVSLVAAAHINSVHAYRLELAAASNSSADTWESTTRAQLATTLAQNYISLRVHPGRTLLHAAAGRGAHDILDMLLAQDNVSQIINLQDACGYTALHYAALVGDAAAIKKLLAKGAEPNSNNLPQARVILYDAHKSRYAPSTRRFTPLHMAVIGCSDCYDMMWSTGVRLVGSPVSVSAALEAVEALLAHAEINPTIQCSMGRAPIHQAIAQKAPELVTAFLKKPGQLELRDGAGKSSDELAAEPGFESIKTAIQLHKASTDASKSVIKRARSQMESLRTFYP